VQARFEDSKRTYEKLGAQFIEMSLPNISASVPTYYSIAPAECSSNLSRFDGVRFGYRAEDTDDLNDLYIKSRSEGFGDEVKRRILIGTYALSAGYYDAYYKKAQQVRRLIKNDFDNVFQSVDILMTPYFT
jgi:aspartyl-tRNA(Asn)/glutamyl-tRNA(Gln) amidotransferase subunit A